MSFFHALIDVFVTTTHFKEKTDPLFSKKIVSSEKVTLVKGDEIIKANNKLPKVWQTSNLLISSKSLIFLNIIRLIRYLKTLMTQS